jgi:hypothetical protein
VRTLLIAFLLSFATVALDTTTYAGKNPHNVFTIETKDDISSHHFLEDGKYFFVHADDILYFFDGENGKEIWKATVPNFEKAGMHVLWGKMKYLVSTEEEEIICYDVYTGKILWQQKYKDIDQDDYLGYDELRDGVMIQYKGIALFIDVNTGKELWRHDFEPESGRHDKGKYTFSSTDWDTDNRILLSTNDGLFLVDAKTGKNLWVKEKDADLTTEDNVKAIEHYGTKMLLFYDNDVIGFLDVKNAKELWTRKQDIGDIEGYLALRNLGGADYLMISTDDQQFMVNLTTGNMQWETKPDQLVGVLTHYKVMDNGKSVLCYFLRRRMTGAESGTYFDLVKLDVQSGKVVWKEKIAYADYAPATGIANFFSTLLLGEKAFQEHDYGFVFDEYDIDGDAVFLIRGVKAASEMEDPTKRDGDGEGLVRINTNTGKIVYRSYFPLNKVGFRWSGVNYDFDAAPKPTVEGDNVYVVGAERVVSANLKTGKINWKIDDDLGFPVDWGIIGNTIYLKVGYQAFNVGVNAKSGNIDASKAWNKDPYRLYAIDAPTGKRLWSIEFENDPGLSMPGGEVSIDPVRGIIIGADEEELFAVRLARDAAGKKLWSLKFDKDLNVGELDHEECYAVTRSSSSSVSVGYNYTTTTTTYSASARHVLYPVLRGDHVVVFGPEGVASVGLDGKVQWRTEWNWAGKKVTLPPQFLSNGKIVFMVKEDIQLLDEKTGKLHWKEEDDYDATPIIPPSNKFLYMMEKDEVRVYKMSE